VGRKGDFKSLKAAVDWFNTNATADSEIVVDGGHFSINDTIFVNNPNYALKISGLGYDITYFDAGTGLIGKSMFSVASEFYMYTFTATGSTLSGYGNSIGENFITFSDTPDNYAEFDDFGVDGFNVGFYDPIGVSYFLFNFEILNCVTAGLQVDYTTNTIEQSIDIEVGNFENCTIGIDLRQTGSGGQSFILVGLYWINYNGQTNIEYSVGNYIYGQNAIILNCYWNLVGTFLGPGFDFLNPVNADIEVLSCIGVENKTPFGTITTSNSTLTVSLTTASIYYVTLINNFTISACKYEMVGPDQDMVYLSHHPYNQVILITGTFTSTSLSTCNVSLAIIRKLDILSVTGDGVTVTVTTTTPHNMLPGNQIQLSDWTGGSGNWNGVQTVTSITSDSIFTYSATGSGTATGGTGVQLVSIASVFMSQQNIPFQFGINGFLPKLHYDDLINLYASADIDNVDIILTSLTVIFKI
jgi:hypothetical protein